MTIADNGQGGLWKCPWCNCIFCSYSDLEKHLGAFRVLGKEPNQYDHKVMWRNELENRKKKEWLLQEGW